MSTAAEPISNYEDLTGYYLDDTDLDALLEAANECVLNWSTSDGWPVGVVHSFVRDADGHFWLTCARRRKRVPAIKRDGRVSVVVNGTGSAVGSGRTVTYKGRCQVHEPGDADWAVIKAWFFPALSARVRPGDREAQERFRQFVDSPGRVILEVTPTWKLTYDGSKMRRATEESVRMGAER